MPEQQIVIIPHGNYRNSYPELIDRKIAREKLGFFSNEKYLLFFGQIKGVKRLDLLLDAFAEVLKLNPDVRLIIAGKVVDVPFQVYQSQIDRLEIGHKCTCLIRYIKNDEVPLLYAASDLVVLPYERIYQSGVLLMAMSFARAVVVSDVPGMLEIVRNGVSGYVFKRGNTSSLSACLISALSNADEIDEIARQGLKLMVSDYGWCKIGITHMNLYKQIIGVF